MATSIPRPSRRATATFHGGVSPVMKVPLDTRVVISRRRAGTVRYIGRIANETGEWYGIALDEAKGDSDGSIDKERYFQCAPNHGVFVRRKEIFQMRDTGSPLKGPPSPGAADVSDDCSTTCSSVAEQPEQTAAPSQSNGSTPSPLMRTFKTFRRQLENIATKSMGGEASGSGSSSPSINNSRPASPASISSPTAAGASRTASMSGLRAPLTRRHSNAPVSAPIPLAATPSPKKRQPSPPPSPTLSLSQSFPSLTHLSTEAPADRSAAATEPSPITTINELALLESIASSTRSASTDSADSSVAPTLTSLGFESPDLFKLPSPLPIANAPVVADNNSAAPVVAIASLDARVAPVTRNFTLELPPTLAQREQSPTPVRLEQSPTPIRLEQSPTPTRLESNDRSAIEQRASKPVDVSPVTRKLALELSPSPTRLKLDDRSPIERRTAKPVDVAASEQTEVTPLTSPRTQASPTPLFLRRTNIGSPSKIERRASFTSSSTSTTGSSPRSSLLRQPTASRIAELEKEIFAMRTNHENVIAVLRATNKQHAANVLELRAQVAALTEGTNYLERQLASKNALVQELQDMETHDRVTRAEVERIISLKDAQIQALEKEIGKLKQHVVRVETEKDSQLCQQFRHFASRREHDEERIAKLREDVVNMCNERISLQSELHDLREMSQWF